ncbi:MAG: aldehyde dehydrogenase family protein [Rhodothermales bacterium]|nr:aldehyde dehydrogenase family protein [Rhodothermales bacterium]
MSDTATAILELPAYIAGDAVHTGRTATVRYPYTGEVVGTAALIGPAEVEHMITRTLKGGEPLTRFQRYEILNNARELLKARTEEFAQSIRRESGLCMKETYYEVGRAQDVLQFAAMEALRDDGQVFSCDITPLGKPRKIFTLREPLRLIFGITPFNHPLNQVAHKIAPAIAAGAPILLKPSEKTPLTALKFAELLYEAGVPGWMLSVFVGTIEEVVEPMIRDERIELVTFTGGTAVGKRIASIAGYKKLCLELGGNSPLIILDDADLDLAVSLAAEGSYRNSGQRCTAVKRILVQDGILEAFTKAFVEKSRSYIAGDPADPKTVVGTVIDEAAAKTLERRVHQAVAEGARVLLGGKRTGALLEPTVIADVPRTTEMVCKESFGPLAPILSVRDIDDAIALANSSDFGLSTGIVTSNLDHALKAVKGIRTGTVNVNQVPGYRIELSPFGGVKDSGLGVKEGVQESIKYMTTVKTFSLPW